MNDGGLLGPDGASRRMQEIQNRIQAFSPQPPPATAVGSSDFHSTLQGVLPADPGMFDLKAVGPYKDMANAAAQKYDLDPKIFQGLSG